MNSVEPATCRVIRFVSLSVTCAAWFFAAPVLGQQPPSVGPETEKRFPSLKVPQGFQATLFACDPLIEYPSSIALGPHAGSIFLAHDYLTGLGTEITRRDEIRLVEDTGGDGYADKSTLYASGFNSIQGMTFHDGTVYAVHSPLLTALRDTDGDGAADRRRDLLSGLGLAPEDNPPRLHCGNGIAMGHDGWLYIALGDHGCNVLRPEGDRLVFNAGGILRCRPDGTDLHVFAKGLRNIYDVALDEQLRVFVRDNENDGGEYKIRVYHSFFGADHGYPYLYYEQPELACPPLADLGLGSSAGGACYLETAFPEEYRGNLFFCEWGRAVVRYRRTPQGSSFAPLEEIEFAAGAENDPYGFKPTDLVMDRDGSLLVADWADGQRPKRGRGRVYRIRYVGKGASIPTIEGAAADRPLAQWLADLNSTSYHTRAAAQREILRRGPDGLQTVRRELHAGSLEERGRLHAVWLLARLAGRESMAELLELAATDPAGSVRAQAVRALADLGDPVLVEHRLDAGRGDAELAEQLAALGSSADSPVLLEIVIALGRLRWPGVPEWTGKHANHADPLLDHAAMQAMRRSENWPAILRLLDEPDTATARRLALRAVARLAVPQVVDGLIERLADRSGSRRREYAALLSLVYKQPAPWQYWGYRPAPRAPGTVVWLHTGAIAAALDRLLNDADPAVRYAVLLRMQQEHAAVRPSSLDRWLKEERDVTRVAAILQSLEDQPAQVVRPLLARIVEDASFAVENRWAAMALFAGSLDGESEAQLVQLAERIEDGPVLAVALGELGKRPRAGGTALLLSKLDSKIAAVRAGAVDALAALNATAAAGPTAELLDDEQAIVRRSAAAAVGRLGLGAASNALLKLAGDADATVRSASIDSLRLLSDPRAVPQALVALDHRDTQAAALEYLAQFGAPAHAEKVALAGKGTRSAGNLSLVVEALAKWHNDPALAAPRRNAIGRAMAEVQGESGLLLHWNLKGPLTPQDASLWIDRQTSNPSAAVPVDWQSAVASGADGVVPVAADTPAQDQWTWLAITSAVVPEGGQAQFLASSDGTLRIWLNGEPVHTRSSTGVFLPESDRFDAALRPGENRILVEITSPKASRFHLRFRRKSSSAEHEQLTRLALANQGNADRGRDLFLNAEKSQCINCHRIGDQGGRIGPALSGVGSRFSRIHLIESMLQPSRTIAPSYNSVAVALHTGQVLTGVKVTEAGETLTLGDEKGKEHVISKSVIEEINIQQTSIMPEGLEKQFTAQEFFDLLAYLLSEKEPAGRGAR